VAIAYPIAALVVPYTLIVCSFTFWDGGGHARTIRRVILPMLSGYVALALQRAPLLIVASIRGRRGDLRRHTHHTGHLHPPRRLSAPAPPSAQAPADVSPPGQPQPSASPQPMAAQSADSNTARAPRPPEPSPPSPVEPNTLARAGGCLRRRVAANLQMVRTSQATSSNRPSGHLARACDDLAEGLHRKLWTPVRVSSPLASCSVSASWV